MELKILSKCNYWLLAILSVFVAGIITQIYMMLNFDVSWLMKVTNKLLNGGHYYTDFIETNPPLILYIYTPAVFLAKIFHIGFNLAFKTYTFIVAIGSLYLCNILMRDIFSNADKYIRYALLIAISFVFILMPGYSFGEREHFALMLTLPYLFLLDLRLSNKSINFYLILLIGIMAGFGFAIKPYFLFTLIACELYFMYKRRNLFACIRSETVIIGAFILIYLSSIFIFNSNYLYKVFPLVYRLYFVAVKAPIRLVLLQGTIIFWLVALGVYFLFYEKLRYRSLATILIFASMGYLISYLIQHNTWYYHLLPTLAIATMLMILLMGEKISDMVAKYKFGIRWFDIILLVLLSIFIVISPIIDTAVHIRTGILTSKHMRTNNLFQYVKRNAYKQSIYVFDDRIIMVSGLVDFAHATSASRFPSQLFMPGIEWLSNMPHLSKTRKKQLAKDKKEITNIVVADLQKYKPKLILENISKINLPPNRKHFDFIRFFSKDSRFRKLFKSYKYITTLSGMAIYMHKDYMHKTISHGGGK